MRLRKGFVLAAISEDTEAGREIMRVFIKNHDLTQDQVSLLSVDNTLIIRTRRIIEWA